MIRRRHDAGTWTMAETTLHEGDRVTWGTSRGRTEGTVEKKVASTTRRAEEVEGRAPAPSRRGPAGPISP